MAFDVEMDRCALLILDHQQLLIDGYVKDPTAHLKKVRSLLALTRDRMPVIHVKVAFRPEYPEISDNNKIFSAVRAGKRFLDDDPRSEIPHELRSVKTDIVIVKHRVSAFEGTDLQLVLRAQRVETLILFGIATSGVVLSTVRQAADLDYRLVVVEDLCHDNDNEIHEFLVQKILPRQAAVVTLEALAARLTAEQGCSE
ncbi:MAG: cysteine hydrolase family protein [Dehalococcoidia bacterium]